MIVRGAMLMLLNTLVVTHANPSQNSPLVFAANSTVIRSESCLRLLQSIRSAYYANSGEYMCKDEIAHSVNQVQCVEIDAAVEFLVVSVQAPTKSQYGSGGACIDFSTQQAICYSVPSNGGFLFGLALDAALQFNVRCPPRLDQVAGHNGVSVCTPVLFAAFFNLWPELCIVTNYITDRESLGPKLLAGYSLGVGKLGLGLKAQGFKVQVFSKGVVTEAGIIANLPNGVHGEGMGSIYSAYSLELSIILGWVTLVCSTLLWFYGLGKRCFCCKSS